MSSFICWIRGDRRTVNQFLDELQAKYLKFNYREYDHNKKKFIEGTDREYCWPISIRYLPLGAWEIVFPETERDAVLTTILGQGWKEQRLKFVNKYCSILRMAMGLKKLPKFNDALFYPIFREGVHIIPIGYKKDKLNKDQQEML